MNEQERLWFRSSLAPFATGLLAEPDESRFRALAAEHSEAKKLLDDYMESLSFEGEPGEHIPSGVLARWATSRESMRGLERYLTRHHLEGCEECRGILQTLGHEADLPWVSELEFDGTIQPATETDERERGRVVESRRTPRWIGGLLGGGALLATAALLMVVFIGPTHHVTVTDKSGAVGVPALTLGPAAKTGTGALRRNLRRIESPTLTVPPGTTKIALRGLPLGKFLEIWESSDELTVRLDRNDSTEPVIEERLALEDLFSEATLVLLYPDGPWVEGGYTLTMARGPFSDDSEWVRPYVMEFRVAVDPN